MVYAAAVSGAASLPERALRTVTAPFSQLSTTISTFITENLDTIFNANHYKSENEELRQTISDLRKQIVDIDELQTDNRLLREMLAISEENPDFEWSLNTCTIINSNSMDVFGGFTINRGSNDGISLQDLVVTQIGVVGIVSEVAPNYSRISTILSTETPIGVLTTSGNVKGILQNDIIHASDGLARMSHIEKNADISTGDIVVTAGGDLYPANQIIGEIVEIYDDPNGISRHALIKPSEDVFSLTNVLVITGFDGKQPLIIDDGSENDKND